MPVLPPATQQWWFRTLLTIGVLAGVMGMHGLTAGHAASMVAAPPAVTVATLVASHSMMTSDDPTPASSPPSTDSRSHGHGPTGGHGGVPACLAVLAAAVGLLALLLRRARPGRPVVQMARSYLSAAVPPTNPPRVWALSLHELSICRT